MDVLFLKSGLAKLLGRYQNDYRTAEQLIEEIGSIASILHEPRIPGIEDCKREIARDFCHVVIRKALRGKYKEYGSVHVQRVKNMVDSGIAPGDFTEKIKFGEIAQIHLAHLHCITGSFEAATRTVRPYIARCCSMAHEDEFVKVAGIQGLAECLLSLGRVDEARSLIKCAYMENGWFCNVCQLQVHAPQLASICLHCFEGVCGTCFGVLEGEPGRAAFCVAGHGLLHSGGGTKSGKVVFRGTEIDVDDFVVCIEAEWV